MCRGVCVCDLHLVPNKLYEYQAQIWGGGGGGPCSVSLSQGILGLKKVEDPCSKRHLPFSTFFLFIFLSIPLTLLSLTLHLFASLHFLSFFQYFPSSLSLYSLYPEPPLFTL